VTLVGHSIGVMIILTYCKRYPAALGTRVDRLVLAQSTYTNPLKTMPLAGLYCALQTPVLTPLCWLMIGTSPLFRVMNWLSYVNGSAHRSTEKESFSGNETRGQLDFMAKYYVKASPAVLAHGILAMFNYDATETLGRIGIPTLIVAGDNDRTCLPEASVAMAKAIPKAQLVVLEASKHCGLFEHPDEFHAAVRTFLHRPDSDGTDGTAGTVAEQKTALLT
jgi:pimeloyl-ACP methyl ester carboxylesterase